MTLFAKIVPPFSPLGSSRRACLCCWGLPRSPCGRCRRPCTLSCNGQGRWWGRRSSGGSWRGDSLVRSQQFSRQALASLRHLDCSLHSSLWSIQGMNELTKASDVTSEPKSEKRNRLSPTNYHFRRSRQLQGFGYRGLREIVFLKYGNTIPNKIKMSVNKIEIQMLESSISAY